MRSSSAPQQGPREGRLAFSDSTAAENRLTLSGRIIEPEVTALRSEGEQWLSSLGAGNCRIDLTAVETASSVLLSLLLCWQRQAGASNLRVRFDGANDRLRELARMSRVADQLPGVDTDPKPSPH